MTKQTAKMLGVAGLLAVGATVFAIALSRQFGDRAAANNGDSRAPVLNGLTHDAAATGVDLLAAYGAYRPGEPVANPFVWIEAEAAAAAPGGEVAPPTSSAPFEPVPMTVSLVLLADPVARAVVDANVVGPGDAVAAGVVTQVTTEGVEIKNGSRRLFYELRRRWPRGYDAPAAVGNDNEASGPSRKKPEPAEHR